MSYILLKIETGTWVGGHDGQYPKLIEWELGCLESPISESEGWGHGLGGGSSTLKGFAKGIRFAKLNSASSSWAYAIISNGLANKLSIKEIEDQLYSESQNHKVTLSEQLQIILNSRVRWVNA
jgi:hypothetical protein